MGTAFELAEHPAEYVLARIRRGLPTSALDQVARTLGLPKGLLAEKLGIAKRTLTRKQSAGRPLSAEESEKLLRVARLRNLLRALFSSDEAISKWLLTPDSVLGDRPPIDLLDTEIGAREVEDLVQSIAHGQFV